ncbi:hypothetical protein SAMN02745823_03645 [Sporobacter termitidis DSM 10068]|uniref:WD40 repeat domain-containing protein n=1 Tax=Sporobacter termitidis DSM 10068 TaxID=1123282 RepID=A0A1M5ZEU4_9FIRM|nr:DUF5711 family protein [Sporobacter termitidis]SHI22785.1 hypothetical protein SAMN02745823_03645 [Sporobacter termitidis DSM 10068]
MAAVDEIKRKNGARKRRRAVRIISSVVVLAVVSLVAAVLVTNNGNLSLDGFKRLLGKTGGAKTADTFSYESGFNNVFADVDGGFAVASTVGIQVFDAGGNKTFTEIYEMANPALSAAGKTGVAYDLGGTALKVFDTAGILGSMTTNGKIISASLNAGGWLALCTQETGGYKASVSVYKPGAYDYTKQPPFKWSSGKGGYILSAAVSPDNKSLAVLTLTSSGSRIVFFSLDSTEEKASCALDGKLAMDLRFTDDSHVLAVGPEALVQIGTDGKNQVLADYTDKYLADYSMNGSDFTALVLSDYMVGGQGRLVTVDKNGKTLGTLETARKITSVSAQGNYLAVLYDDGLVIYDRNLKESARDDDTAGTVKTMMRSDGSALLITSHSASVFSFKAG